MQLRSWFTDHPTSAGETYGEHFRVAMGFSTKMIGAGLAAAVHAIFPALHETTASDRIRELHCCLESGDRHAIATPRRPRALRAYAGERDHPGRRAALARAINSMAVRQLR